jgi:hypothetical protein
MKESTAYEEHEEDTGIALSLSIHVKTSINDCQSLNSTIDKKLQK